ncbi:hypothetical protein Tco_1237825 [Tanacetum coccineum]
MAEIGCNWARIGPSKSSQSCQFAHIMAVEIRLRAHLSHKVFIIKLLAFPAHQMVRLHPTVFFSYAPFELLIQLIYLTLAFLDFGLDFAQSFPFHAQRTIDQSPGGKLRDRNAKESWALLEDLALYDNESWNDPRDLAKSVKAITLPQDVLSTSDRRLIELENHVQRLMEAHLAPTQPTQVNKITTSCEICSGPHDTQYCMKDPGQVFVEYTSLRTNKAGGKWYTFRPEKNNFGDTYNPSWKSHSNLRWRQPQNSQNNFSNPPNRFYPDGSIPNHSFNNRSQSFNNQSNIEGLVSNFMASQDARLSKFKANFKQQQSKMTNKINTVLKAIIDQLAGSLPSDTVKYPKLSTSPVLSARSYPTIDPQCSSHPSTSINAIKAHSKEANIS